MFFDVVTENVAPTEITDDRIAQLDIDDESTDPATDQPGTDELPTPESP